VLLFEEIKKYSYKDCNSIYDILNELGGGLLNILHALKSYKAVAMQLQEQLCFICRTKQF